MRSGRLRHRLTVQEQGQSQDPQTGEIISAWVNTGLKIWASVEPLSGRDFIAASAQQSGITARVKTRYVDGINSTMRFLNEKTSEVWNIKSPPLTDAKSGREYITFMVSQGVEVVP